MISLFSSFLVALCLSTANAGQKDAKNTVAHGDATYYFSDIKATWKSASSHCHQLGGHLTSIHTKSENDFVTNELAKRKMGYSWTGGRDAAKEGTWTWSNLTPFVYKNWMKHSTRKDEPNNSGGNENCLEMGQRGWNDLDCAKTRPFVCKFVKDAKNTVAHGDSTYYFSNTKATWKSASSHCQQLGGDLTSIHSKIENDFVTNELTKRKMGYSWTGGRDAAKEGTWTWSNLTPFVYKNWMKHSTRKDEPNNSGGNENCLEMGQRGWNDLDCAKTRPFVCKFVKDKEDHEDATYYFSNTKATWKSASSHCQQLGGDLTSIHTKSENDFVTNELTKRKMGYSWTGGRDAAKEGTWTWSDLSPFVYTNWMKHSTRKDEPNNSGGNENCLEMGQLGWNDLDCAKTRSFICKIINFDVAVQGWSDRFQSAKF